MFIIDDLKYMFNLKVYFHLRLITDKAGLLMNKLPKDLHYVRELKDPAQEDF